jgi:hypothetical protein
MATSAKPTSTSEMAWKAVQAMRSAGCAENRPIQASGTCAARAASPGRGGTRASSNRARVKSQKKPAPRVESAQVRVTSQPISPPELRSRPQLNSAWPAAAMKKIGPAQPMTPRGRDARIARATTAKPPAAAKRTAVSSRGSTGGALPRS